MKENNHIFSKFTINGFTINPIIDDVILINIMKGLTQYPESHYCDHGIEKKIHKNYLGKIISEPYVVMNESKDNHGLMGVCFLENGYFVIKIWDKIFPAQIQVDFFITNDVADLDLILDHLCATALPYDGLGMFDYTYSKTTFPPISHILEKNIKNDSSYLVNPPIKFLNKEKSKWEVKLNQLSSIFCYFCDNIASEWILFNKANIHHAIFKTIAVCKEHIKMGRRGEVIPNSQDHTASADFYTSEHVNKVVLTNIYDENGMNHSINIFKNNIQS